MSKAPSAATTKARHLIDRASFGPDALKAIGEAFDAAWAAICANSEALLSIADEDSRDVEVLKRAALQRMALDYKRRR